mmetsp:Transcript_947/g.945  ORF Transcript_947/g.945 Transcript_947/m.945 type:complete len:137 (-) Transcript_947:389-799(-)
MMLMNGLEESKAVILASIILLLAMGLKVSSPHLKAAGNNNKYRTRDETNEPQTQETAIFGQKDLESVSAFTKDANNKSEKSSQNADPGFYDSNIENSMAEISQRRSTKKLFKASKYEESKHDKRIGYSSDDHYPKV